MTAAEFKRKWHRYTGKETSAYQEHFNDLCRLLGQPTPAEADPSGSDFFCFQKRVVKDAELFALHDSGEEAASEERGFADVWKKDCFAWEYKGKKKNLDEAYRQLLRYRESLLKPPSFRDPDTTRSGRPAPLRHGEAGRLWAPALLSMLLFSLVVIGLVSAQDDSFGWLT